MTRHDASRTRQILAVRLGEHMLGIDIACIGDVLHRMPTTPVPLAGDKIDGVINLRGHVVTMIRVSACVGQPCNDAERMTVVVENGKELFGLLVDSVDDIHALDSGMMEPVPPTLNPAWHGIAEGVFRLPEGVMIVLETEKLVQSACVPEAEAL